MTAGASTNGRATFREVSNKRPCPSCRHTSWCQVSDCGTWCICRREGGNGGEQRADKTGATYWKHRLIPAENTLPEPTCSQRDSGGKKAGADVLHKVYSALLAELPLGARHVNDLERRGLVTSGASAAAHAKRLGYKSLFGKGRAKIVAALIAAGLEKLLPGVPGFYVKEEGGKRWWSLSGQPGLVIPVRDAKGRIVALSIRLDEPPTDGSKYRWLSTKKHAGAGPGVPIHCPLWEGSRALVRVTEGALKADVATALSAVPTIGVSGVGSWRFVAKTAKALGAATVRVAYDADARTNRQVAGHLAQLVKDLEAKGFTVELETWPVEQGKGIDDLLAAGQQPRVIAGSEAVHHAVNDIIQAAVANDPPEATQAKAAAKQGQANEAIDDPFRLARLLIKKRFTHPEGKLLTYYQEQFWHYSGACWRQLPDSEVNSRVSRYCKQQLDEDNVELVLNWKSEEPPPKVPKVTTPLIGNVRQALGSMTWLSNDCPLPSWIDGEQCEARRYVALRNGLLDIEPMLKGRPPTLLSHSPQWFSPVCFDFDYNPAATCPLWDRVMLRNLEGHAGKIKLLQQWAGYLLFPDTRFQRFLMMEGEGANGKSVICAALTALLGVWNCSSVALELFGERFHLVETIGKLANIVPEVGELDKVCEGRIKAFVTGDPIMFERKHKTPFTARPTARLMLATNSPPQFSDKSDGIWRRLLLLKFTAQIPPNERIADLDSPGYWQRSGELPGILNWALAGLQSLYDAGRFEVPKEVEADAENLRTDSNPARRFLVERYMFHASAQTPKDEVYQQYREWCGQQGHHCLASNKFSSEVFRTFKGAKAGKTSTASGRVPCYSGVSVRVEFGDDEDTVAL